MVQRSQRDAQAEPSDPGDDDIEWEELTELTLDMQPVEPDTIESAPPWLEADANNPAATPSPPPARTSVASHVHDIPFPSQLGSYEVLIPIGSSATATVFLGRVPVLGGTWQYVALKLIHADILKNNPVLRHRILREVKLASELRHANVVSFVDMGEAPEGVFFAMDYVEGDTLSSLMPRLAGGQEWTPIPVAMRIFQDMLEGLDAIHSLCEEGGRSLGVVHRDVAPQNILVSTEGVSQFIDLGIAKIPSWTQVTHRRSVLGRLPYMAPEQVAGADGDERCDVWAAGVIMWELLAGRRLFPDKSLRSLVDRMRVTPPGLRSIRKDVPVALERAIASALMSNVKDRCPTAKQLHARVRNAWSLSGTIADPAEVGALVQQAVEPKLKERKQAVMELLRYRRALSDLTQTAMRELVDEDGTSAPHVISMPPLDQSKY